MSVRFQDSDGAPTLTDACGVEPAFVCEKMFDWTGSEFAAIAAEWVLDRPIRILLISIAAWIISRVLQRAVMRFVKTVANPPHKALDQLRERRSEEHTSERSHAC